MEEGIKGSCKSVSLALTQICELLGSIEDDLSNMGGMKMGGVGRFKMTESGLLSSQQTGIISYNLTS